MPRKSKTTRLFNAILRNYFIRKELGILKQEDAEDFREIFMSYFIGKVNEDSDKLQKLLDKH